MDYINRAWVRTRTVLYNLSEGDMSANLGMIGRTTEGDVEGIMDRPTGDGMEAQAEREKW